MEPPLGSAPWPGIPGPPNPPEEEVLAGGNMAEVVRVGNTVHRPAGAWTRAVHALLGYLVRSGFEAAPRVLGMDAEGREVLSFIEGETVSTPVAENVWFGSMTDAARLLRRYHDLTVAFVPPPNAVWRHHPADAGPPEVVCHSDWAPFNAVWRDGRLVGIIDWDFARPGSRLYDLAWFMLMWCPLDLREGPQPGLTDPIDQPARLRLACDSYGLMDRSGVLAAIRARVESSVQWIEDGATAGDPARAKLKAEGHGEHYRRVLRHLEQRWDELAAALA